MKRYFTNSEHFINAVNRILKDSGVEIDKSKLREQEFYIEEVWNNWMAEWFTRELKSNPFLIYEENTVIWVDSNKSDLGKALLGELPRYIKADKIGGE